MARRLEGKKFFVEYNNGVTAIISEEIHRNRGRVAAIRGWLEENELLRGGLIVPDPFSIAIREGLSHIPQVPIFTFTSTKRVSQQFWFTGNEYLQNALLAWIVAEGGSHEGGSHFVPFSNGSELGAHGVDAMRDELKYVTTEAQFRDAFGIDPREVVEWYARKHQNEDVPNRY